MWVIFLPHVLKDRTSELSFRTCGSYSLVQPNYLLQIGLILPTPSSVEYPKHLLTNYLCWVSNSHPHPLLWELWVKLGHMWLLSAEIVTASLCLSPPPHQIELHPLGPPCSESSCELKPPLWRRTVFVCFPPSTGLEVDLTMNSTFNSFSSTRQLNSQKRELVHQQFGILFLDSKGVDWRVQCRRHGSPCLTEP